MLESLRASLMGCKNPKKETLLGPKRNPTNPKILRSKRVIKATHKSRGITKKRSLKVKTTKKNLNGVIS